MPGLTGPAPLTADELARRGSKKARRRAVTQMTLEPGAPEPPADLPDEARTEWDRLVKLLEPTRCLTQADRMGLDLLCRLWAEERELSRVLYASGSAAGHSVDDRALARLTPRQRQTLALARTRQRAHRALTQAQVDVMAEYDRVLAEEQQAADLVPGSPEWRGLITTRRDVRAQLMNMLARFGLTPADRPRVRTVPAKRAEDPVAAKIAAARRGGTLRFPAG